MTKIKFEKEKFSTIKDIGHSNASFYAYCIIDGKREGTVWKFKDGKYVFNEDFKRDIHDKDNRPTQVVAKNLTELRALLAYKD